MALVCLISLLGVNYNNYIAYLYPIGRAKCDYANILLISKRTSHEA